MSVPILIIGGPLDGKVYEKESSYPTVVVPVQEAGGLCGTYAYTVRKCWNANNDQVLVLAPAGQNIDTAKLKKYGLRN